MLRNYFTIGLRNLLRQRGYSALKIAGLAFGLATSIIIYLYIQEDLSYDRFNKNYDRIARVLTIDSSEGVSSKLVGVTQGGLAPAIQQEVPEVEKAIRINGGGKYDLQYEENTLKCEAAFRTESAFFDFFDFKIVKGNKEGILDKPGSIVITETLAKKIFGAEDPIGKTVKLNQNTDLFVNGVIADVPKNSHLQFDLLRSLTPGENEQGLQQFLQGWQGIGMFTYILVKDNMGETILNTKIQELTRKNNAYEFFKPVIQPLSQIHLHSKEILFETNANKSDVLNVYVLSIIAGLILLLAAVNFMNLVTARSVGRAKEVGMRKVIGAVRYQLIGQHLTESILVAGIAMLIALALTALILPNLNNVYQRYADINMLLESGSIVKIILLTLITGTLAGLYPAFVLSGFKPIIVLKGAFKNSTSGIQLRRALVVVQFTISIALMIGTSIVFQQMQFIFKSDLGYSRDQIITIPQSGGAVARGNTLRNELLSNPSILSVGTASSQVGQQLGRTNIVPEGHDTNSNIITSIMAVDENYIPTMGMTMAAGRNFSLDFDDSLSMVINEEMVKLLDWDDAIGKRIGLSSGPEPTDLTNYTVVGVVKNFHFATIRHELEPMFMLYSSQNPSMAVKLSAGNTPENIAFLESAWKKVNPGTTFEFNFLDEQFARLYRNDQAFATMFSHFTILAITIAALGLFALSAFTAEQRKKEIGIRKTLGANNLTIFLKLSNEFMLLIVIAFVLASGLSYPVMLKWLEDFSYSVKITYITFVMAGLASLLIALLTISYQALKAAGSNPIDALRSE